MAALIIAIFPQNSSRGNWEEQQDRTDPNSRFELARKPAWLLAFRQFGLPKWKHDFESFSLRPLRYISKYIFMANLRFVYRKSALKLGTVAVRILLENASFRQVLKPVRTSKLTFPRVIWRHPAKHPLGFRVTPLRPLEYYSTLCFCRIFRTMQGPCPALGGSPGPE